MNNPSNNWKVDVVKASRTLNLLSETEIKNVLLTLADAAEANTELILSENKKDLAAMSPDNPMYDRLMLTEQRIKDIAADIRNVASLPNPLGKVISEFERPNGMLIKKVSVPFGVVGIIYEARPNVSFDVFSLCFKSGNACVLKGGSDAAFSNTAIVNLIHMVLRSYNIDENSVVLLPSAREAIADLMNAVGFVDVIIPRGGKGLIEYVRDNSRVPVIETGAGICHTYFDEYGDLEKGRNIVFNAKTRRVSVCNSLDCLVVHKKRIDDLPALCEKLAEKDVEIYADDASFATLLNHYPENLLFHANAESYGTEFLSYKMAIKTAEDFNEAIEHIAKYSSKHSESIVSENDARIKSFQKMVDAACVYSNVSTAFTDGAQFGLGAEIGISTQKLHARGPMALEEICSYKWIIEGDGQTRK